MKDSLKSTSLYDTVINRVADIHIMVKTNFLNVAAANMNILAHLLKPKFNFLISSILSILIYFFFFRGPRMFSMLQKSKLFMKYCWMLWQLPRPSTPLIFQRIPYMMSLSARQEQCLKMWRICLESLRTAPRLLQGRFQGAEVDTSPLRFPLLKGNRVKGKHLIRTPASKRSLKNTIREQQLILTWKVPKNYQYHSMKIAHSGKRNSDNNL